MAKRDSSIARDLAQAAGFDNVKRVGKWHGFDVFDPDYNDDIIRYIGLPQFILVKDGVSRWSSPDEAFEIMDAVLF